jgi:hypothetical protein
MTPSSDRPDPSRPRRLAAGLSLALATGLLTAVGGAGGCSKPPQGTKQPEDAAGPKGNPWAVAGARLRKDTDVAATRAALAGLTNDLAADAGAKPAPLSDEALAKLGAVVPLSPADREEIRGGSTFTAHDGVYLADCLYLRDAARSLALAGVPPGRQAELAFAWVCRQVYLNPWLQEVGEGQYQPVPVALPPTAVLRRGSGSGLERMYVFLALLQQMGLDGCLIGGPDADKLHSTHAVPTPDKKALVTGGLRGPFWAVGVRHDVKLLGAKVGSVVKLFDPWRGESIPFTLGQLKTDASKAWFEDKANVSGATHDDAKKATVYLAVPVNSLSPRMAAFDAHLKGELAVKTSYDPAALRSAFPDPKPAVWNPPEDPFAYGRASRSFLPLDMGGADRTPSGATRLYESYIREQIPPKVIAPVELLQAGHAQDFVRANAAGRLLTAFIEPPNPRERIQRGQFQDAAKDLVGKQEGFAAGLERLRNSRDADQQIREWCEEANRLFEELGRARLPGNTDKAAEAVAQARVEAHLRQPGATLLIDRASAELGQAEATFLLAVCKHEQAERAQARLERAAGPDVARLRADATDAWRNALSAWRTYEQMAGGQAGFPGRLAHAKTLTARAETLARGEEKK